MRGTGKTGSVVWLAALLASASVAPAQQKDPRLSAPTAPIPPISNDSSSKAAVDPAAAPAPQSGRATTLNGVDGNALGGGWSGRTFLVPSFTVEFHGERNPSGTRTHTSAGGAFSGRLAMQRAWGRFGLTSDYNGSSRIGLYQSSERDMFHNWQLAYRAAFRRWNLSFTNSLGFSPQGGTGGGFFNPQLNTASGFGNSQIVNLNPFLQQNEAILATNSARITNSSSAQAAFTLDSKSSLSVSGSYGLMRFLEGGLIESNNYSVRTGYNRTLSARDSFGVNYSMSVFGFSDGQRDNRSHIAHFSYGRQISNRLAVNLSAGPEFSLVQVAAGSERWQNSWNVRAGLNYRMERSNVSLTYMHGVTGGAGFFRGAVSDDVTAAFSRPLTRMWTGSASFGYALNRSLVDIATGGVGGQRFDTWRGGFNLGRPLGRQAQMFFRYGIERQTSESIACITPVCGFSGTRQTFGIGFSFSLSPIELN